MIATTLNPAIFKFRHPQNPFKPTKLRYPFAAINCKAEQSKESGTSSRGGAVEDNPKSGNGNGRRPPIRKSKGKRGAYGTSRKSILKKSFSQEQIFFTSPIADDPVVAIIGGGISGILCALALEKRGIRSTVFDTGMHGLGGRLGTRTIDSQPLVFDHAAQFFTASDPRFRELVDGWLEKGLICEWNGQIGELEAGRFVPFPSTPVKYVGVHGMRPLADAILSKLIMIVQSTAASVIRPCWISTLEPYNGMWHLSENGKPRGQFDAIVIAHNGNLKQMAWSLSVRLELSSIWALLAAFEEPLSLQSHSSIPFEGAFVRGDDALSWMANNTKKLFPLQSRRPDCWTFFSSAAYGKRNKVPQENIPNVTADKVKKEMLQVTVLQLPTIAGVYRGAALPTNTPGLPCIFDPHGRAGICGDWLLGSSVEAASLSGMALANHIADFIQSGGAQPEDFAVGLHDEFHPIKGHDIGQFPGLDTKEEVSAVLSM
ncbi:hypothetical protein EJ110_NYTH19808 [Nymphaea thermarum]|nr:hypothetical protein EJ110_NYTH19808 [Nymphaea thermarum]